MHEVKEDLLKILNQALELEQSAKVKYSTRAELITASLAKIEEGQRLKGIMEMPVLNLRNEKEAISFYRRIRHKVGDYRKELQTEFERLEGEIRNVIREEQEHSERLLLFIRQLEATVVSV
jgi:hypothetical protein